MVKLQDIIEKSDAESNDDVSDELESENKSTKERYTEPTPINIPKRRGRPPGSHNANTRSKTTSSKSNLTSVEKQWAEIAAIGVGLVSMGFSLQVMNNPKFIMTPDEARSAANGIVYVLFQYKQIREFAMMSNMDSPYMVLIRGFMPYLTRVFLKDMVDYVVSGFTAKPKSTTGQRQSDTNKQRNDAGISNDANVNAEPRPIQFNPNIIQSNWRNAD